MTPTPAQIEITAAIRALKEQWAEIERLKVKVIERDSAIAGWIKREAATIERCAQVVSDCLIRFQKQHDEDDQFSGIAVAALIADFVAAIRALKDT